MCLILLCVIIINGPGPIPHYLFYLLNLLKAKRLCNIHIHMYMMKCSGAFHVGGQWCKRSMHSVSNTAFQFLFILDSNCSYIHKSFQITAYTEI